LKTIREGRINQLVSAKEWDKYFSLAVLTHPENCEYQLGRVSGLCILGDSRGD
jgi:hypothetical protein